MMIHVVCMVVQVVAEKMFKKAQTKITSSASGARAVVMNLML